ncbi:MAG: YwiC-like family protein [Acidobacteria bacterium]|nr:YwiC-like family protein [Acidobacteriota bacterium]MCL5287328.1 YwiC-like family protein [Acidobacteriota bacterium]
MAIRMPAEHGAWGMLLIPYLSAAAVAGAWNVPVALCGALALGLFVLRGSAEQQGGWRALRMPEHVALAIVLLAMAGALVMAYERTQLIGVAAAGGALYMMQEMLVRVHNEARTEKRSLAAELVGVMLLSLAAPAAWIAARGRLEAAGVQVWALNVLFFLGGVLYVKYRVRGLLAHREFSGWGERLAFAWPVFFYHFLLVAFLVSAIFLRELSWAVLLAFAPGILRANGLVFQLGEKFPIKRLGWMEVAHAVAFAGLLVIAFRFAM